mmetsp:Transcript_51577/g.149779  ORF Transcript_51577/g.149779 Transcript_51577/m.149779 type:complete len:146 (-) Transcript_51577:49-486(-)
MLVGPARLLARAGPPPLRLGVALVSRRWRMAAAYRGPVQEHIEAKVQEALKPLHLEVANESHGRATDESHFHVLVVSEEFNGLKALERHRLVNQLFTGEDGALKFHSLRITAKTPEVWAKNQTAPEAPKCTGKGDGRSPTDASAL